MSLKTLGCALGLCLQLLVREADARDSRAVVELKVAKQSGFLGLGAARFVSIALVSSSGDTVLSNETVNAGQTYTFLVEAAGDWTLDADFVHEELPKLAIDQDTLRLKSEHRNRKDSPDARSTLIEFNKQLGIHRPITFTFPLGDSMASATMKVPIEYWPGYPKLERLFASAETELDSSRLKSAIALYEQILHDRSLSIFPRYNEAKGKRRQAFATCLQNAYADLVSLRVQGTSSLAQSIAVATTQLNAFRFVADSLANETLGIFPADSVNVELTLRALKKVEQATLLIDSLQQALDNENTKWVILGGTGGSADFKYKNLIPALAHAYLEVDFNDTTSKEVHATVPGPRTILLKRFNLIETFNTFVRLMNVRRKNSLSLFPPEFLVNVKRDTMSFSLPYYSALKAVNDFCLGNDAEALREAQAGINMSFDMELTLLLDQLRLLLKARLEKTPEEITRGMREAAATEETGNATKAIEMYKTVRLMQENYAPASLALGELYERTADRQIASSMFQKAIQSDPWYVSAYYALYENASASGGFVNVIDALTQAKSRGADLYFLHYYLASAFNKTGKHEEALKAAQAALSLNYRSPEAHNQAGAAHIGLKRLTKARECYRHATEIDPENILANEGLKRIHEMMNTDTNSE